MSITSFPFEIQQPIQYRDLDPQNHVNNIAYLIYFENIRVIFARHLNAGAVFDNVLVEVTCRYKAQTFLDDTLYLGLRVAYIGTKSFAYDYRLAKANGLIAAEGSSVQIWFDHEQQASAPIPDHIRQLLEHYQ